MKASGEFSCLQTLQYQRGGLWYRSAIMQAAARQPRSMRSKKRATGVVTFHLTKLKHRSTRKQVFGHNADCCNTPAHIFFPLGLGLRSLCVQGHDLAPLISLTARKNSSMQMQEWKIQICIGKNQSKIKLRVKW